MSSRILAVLLKLHLNSHHITCSQSKDTLTTALLSKPKFSGCKAPGVFLTPRERIPVGKGIAKQQPLENTLPPFSRHFVIHRCWSTCKVLQLCVSLATSLGLLDGISPPSPLQGFPEASCFIGLPPLPLRAGPQCSDFKTW